jgi:putative ABC transport system substrate-binding protein
LDHRLPAEQPEQFRTLARDLVEVKIDLIVAVTGLGAKAAKQAVGSIPIVLVAIFFSNALRSNNGRRRRS